MLYFNFCVNNYLAVFHRLLCVQIICQPISFRIWSRAFRSTDKKSKILETFTLRGWVYPSPTPSRTPQIQNLPPLDGPLAFEKVDFTQVFVCFLSFDEPVARGILTFTQVFVCFLNCHKPVA